MEDTIVAISTALAKGAISIVRLSGSEAISIVNSVFSGKDLTKVDSHTINYGYIVNNEEKIDEVLVSIMKAPKTFTTEDIVEINCHGGIIATNKILELMLLKGARLAEAGEFTKRAFLNGRIDLTEAEAVMDIIESKSEEALDISINQLSGKTKKLIDNYRDNLKDLLSKIEVNIDYPEYHDIEVTTIEDIKRELKIMSKDLKEVISQSKNTRLVKEGIKTIIVGRPNVGKSSILNQMLEKEKAIVTNVAGTTRDIVEGEAYLDGILLNIIDTAGIRKTEDVVEKIGVEKSLRLIDEADLVIVVLNGNEKLTTEDKEILEKTKDKTRIIAINKNDLEKYIDLKEDYENTIYTNTKDLVGINTLKEKIKSLFKLDVFNSKDSTYLTNARQTAKAKEALEQLKEAEIAINNNLPIDMIEINLKEVFETLGEIIGDTYSEEIIDHLFANFCVGK